MSPTLTDEQGDVISAVNSFEDECFSVTLIKTSLFNSIAVVIKMLTMLGLNKVLAVYVGPAGYVAIGNFQNALQMILIFAGGSFDTGIVKYTAEYSDDEAAQRKLWQTSGTWHY